MPDDPTSRTLLAVVVAALVCCGGAWLLVSAGLLAAGGGLLGSPELTVAAVAVAVIGLWRIAVALRRKDR